MRISTITIIISLLLGFYSTALFGGSSNEDIESMDNSQLHVEYDKVKQRQKENDKYMNIGLGILLASISVSLISGVGFIYSDFGVIGSNSNAWLAIVFLSLGTSLIIPPIFLGKLSAVDWKIRQRAYHIWYQQYKNDPELSSKERLRYKHDIVNIEHGRKMAVRGSFGAVALYVSSISFIFLSGEFVPSVKLGTKAIILTGTGLSITGLIFSTIGLVKGLVKYTKGLLHLLHNCNSLRQYNKRNPGTHFKLKFLPALPETSISIGSRNSQLALLWRF